MSLHYHWTLAVRLRPDTPAAFLAEARFHLGLTDQPPEHPTLDVEWPCLPAQPPHENRLDGFDLSVQTYVLDDAMYELVRVVPPWLARWSLTQGLIGVAREDLDERPWLHFYVQDGHAYAGDPGGPVHPLDDTSPPFTGPAPAASP